jgi:hypothetical protein
MTSSNGCGNIICFPAPELSVPGTFNSGRSFLPDTELPSLYADIKAFSLPDFL